MFVTIALMCRGGDSFTNDSLWDCLVFRIRRFCFVTPLLNKNYGTTEIVTLKEVPQTKL